MKLLDGKVASAHIREELKKNISHNKHKFPRPPHLAAILVGNDGASETYVASKIKNCEQIGMQSSLIRFPADSTQRELEEKIIEINGDPGIDGLIVQLPLPKHIDETKIIELINPEKDVDGFHPVNAGKLMLGQKGFVSATPLGILYLLKYYDIETAGKNAVIVGRSNIVGRPLSILLSLNKDPGNCTVTLAHSRTKNLRDVCLTADILVAAIGIPGFITADMVKEKAVVIDVGITRIDDSSKKSGYSLKGDVDFENVSKKCSYITPVPGGVGLMTIAALLSNTYNAYLNKFNGK